MNDDLEIPAREQLDLAHRANIGTEADRRIFAWSFIGFGISVGLAPVVVRSDGTAHTVVLLVYAALLLAFSLLQSRARSMPLGTKRITWWAAAGSVLLLGFGIITLVLLDPATWWQFTVVAVLTALPMVIGGTLVGRAGRAGRRA